MRFNSLSQWLAWQERLHFTEIDPGLERVAKVWHQMGGSSKLPFKVVTVAGTNGKGSSVAMSAAILRAAGYQVATYTSPHLLAYNERIAINGQPCSDEEICLAFERIDTARHGISLTYFEFATLAAADIFSRHQVDIAVLEVGMGGRLDAVNLFDADIALITPISLDHMTWLGDTREQIGREKAGIIRRGQFVVCSESAPPASVIDYAHDLQATSYIAARDYQWQTKETGWAWQNTETIYSDLPIPALAGHYQLQNAAAVIQICYLLNSLGFNIAENAIKQGLQQVNLAGRFQILEGPVTRILDVTHNQQGAENLRHLLQEKPGSGRIYAVLAMLKDKDSQAVADSLKEIIDFWYLAGLDGNRGMSAEQLQQTLMPIIGEDKTACYETVTMAYESAMKAAKAGDRVLIFGSFHTVEALMRILPEARTSLAPTF